MKRLKAFERRMVNWTLDNPRQYRAIVTVTFVASLVVQGRGLLYASYVWLQILHGAVAVFFVVAYAALVYSWRRHDLLDELRLLVGEQTDDHALLGNVAWFWGYHAPTRTLREVVEWLRTHNIARTPADDMPQPVRVLVRVLTESL